MAAVLEGHEKGDEDLQIAQRDFSRLQADHMKAGYREGISSGKEASLQAGFNDGFENGVDCILQWGILKGKISALKTYCESRRSLPLALLEEVTLLLKEVGEEEEKWRGRTLGYHVEQYRRQTVQAQGAPEGIAPSGESPFTPLGDSGGIVPGSLPKVRPPGDSGGRVPGSLPKVRPPGDSGGRVPGSLPKVRPPGVGQPQELLEIERKMEAVKGEVVRSQTTV